MLIHNTSTVEYIDHMGDDLRVVNAARVSFNKESEWEWVDCPDRVPVRGDTINAHGHFKQLPNRDAKLINYLAKHKHKSPFNHCFASFKVKMPIFVARQLVKHEYLTWNEVSRRYVDDEVEFFEPEEWRKRGDNVKQGSSDEVFSDILLNKIQGLSQENIETALYTYDEMLYEGVCPEQARMVLPQNMMTEVYWSGSLAAWAKMCNLRLDPHAQKESREVAEQVSKTMASLFPVSWAALMEYPIL